MLNIVHVCYLHFTLLFLFNWSLNDQGCRYAIKHHNFLSIYLSISFSDEFYNQDAVTRFWTYFYNLKPDTGSNTGPNVNKHNPWFTQFWQDMFNCRIDLGTCDLNRDLQGMVPDSDVYVPFTLMAVDAVIRGVQQATQTYCGGAQLCSELLNREDDKLYLCKQIYFYLI